MTIKNMVIVVLLLMVLSLAVAFVEAQVVPVPERSVSLWIVPGDDGRFYVFCAQGCDRLLEVADVTELYAGFDLATDAHNHGLILMARLNGGVARLLPGTSYTPTP